MDASLRERDEPARTPRVALMTMPWLSPDASCLALSTLAPILRASGIACDIIYGSLLFPRTTTRQSLLEKLVGMFLFVPHLYPDTDMDALIAKMMAAARDQLTMRALVPCDDAEAWRLLGASGLRPDNLAAQLCDDIARAGVCLDRCAEVILAGDYDVVGFSSTFESQHISALALAARLKRERPGIKIVFGGSACAGEQADGLVVSFPTIDVACYSEGESVVVPLVRALTSGSPLAEVPGIAFVDAAGVLHHTPAPPLLEDLDSLPRPRYEEYLAQLAASEWGDLKPRLFFETSRGCWWGQKHLCTFCGLNDEGLAFRSKSPGRAFAEIVELYRDYPQARQLSATDNILDTRYFDTLLVDLARLERVPDRPLHIFFEIKSNLKSHQVALLAAAGIRTVQPGIESLDDQVLALMDKGCTALGQIQFLKWAYQERVHPMWMFIVFNPGEDPAAYRRMLELLPFVTHLPPPGGLTPMLLERFSPYFERPASFGITGRTPHPAYRELYRGPSADLDRLAYEFEYDHPMFADAEHVRLVHEFVIRVLHEWCKDWKALRAHAAVVEGQLVIHDRRSGSLVVEPLAELEADLFRYLDSARSFTAIARRFAGTSPDALRALLARWHARRIIYSSPDDVHLAVLPELRECPRTLDEILASAPGANRSLRMVR